MSVITALYCDKDHRLHDGYPVGHACVVLPPEALHLEKEGSLSLALEAMKAAGPLRPHNGVRREPPDRFVKTLAQVEREHMEYALSAFGWNFARAAESLGVDRRTLYRMVKRHGIRVPPDRPVQEEVAPAPPPSPSTVAAPFPDAFVADADSPLLRSWSCPRCGGDCFGTSRGRYHCHGSSEGTETEQTSGCGFWQSTDRPLRNGARDP